MRKYILYLILSVMSVGSAWAEYPFMSFKTIDGIEHSIASSGLEISINDGVLTATTQDEKLQLPLASLVSMQFSETSNSITDVITDSFVGNVDVYSLDGALLGTFDGVAQVSQKLEAGIYIVKNNKGKTCKIAVKK